MVLDLENQFNLPLLWQGLDERKAVSPQGIHDWMGNFFEYGSFPALPPPGWQSPCFPTDTDGFRAGTIEWIAFGLAAGLAKAHSYAPILIEAGASQGLWCLPWIRALMKISPEQDKIKAIAYEASPSIAAAVDFWLNQDLVICKKEYSDRCFSLYSDTWTFTWRQEGIGGKTGIADFPRVNCRSNNGSSISSPTQKRWRDRAREVIKAKTNPDDFHANSIRVEIKSLESVTSAYPSISLIHMDIQGAEKDVLESSGIGSALSHVGILQLGTHSPEIDGLAKALLPGCGFTLLAEEPCEVKKTSEGLDMLLKDGEQLWASNRAVEECTRLCLIRKPGIR